MHKKKILVVDDDEDFASTLECTLSDSGYSICVKHSGSEAYNFLIKESEIEVVLVDLELNMPGFTGLDFLDKIKTFNRPIQRIVLTGNDHMMSEKDVEELKIFSYISKPFSLRPLLFTVKSAFNELELEEARQWKNMSFVTTEIVHLIGNKISPIKRRIENISDLLTLLYKKETVLESEFTKLMKDISIIRDGADQVHRIKSDLIGANVHKEHVNVNNVLDEVVAKSKCENEDVTFTCITATVQCCVDAQIENMIRVFEYIIKNAVQAIEDKRFNQTGIQIEAGEITVTSYTRDSFIVIDIRDNGSGIKDEDLANIFKPFFSTKGADRGSGVGLYFCKRVVEDCGGKIYIKETTQEIGTMISIELPLIETVYAAL